jgi:hypothetical protein
MDNRDQWRGTEKLWAINTSAVYFLAEKSLVFQELTIDFVQAAFTIAQWWDLVVQ